MSYISACGFSDGFAGGGWVCIVLPSHTFASHEWACHEWGPIPGSVKLRNRGVV